MKPKDLIKQTLGEKIEPILSNLGFVFLKSALKFSRKWNEFTHIISVSPNRHNQEDFAVQFHTSFGVYSKKYVHWYLSEYGENPVNESIAGENDWTIKGWNYPIYKSQFKNQFDIANEENREEVLDVLILNTINIGIPYLENNSDWQAAAKELLKRGWFYSKACDFYLIAGEREKAYKCLKIGQNLSNKSFPDEPEAIKLRLEKHFNE